MFNPVILLIFRPLINLSFTLIQTNPGYTMRHTFILLFCLLITSAAVAQPLASLSEAKHRSPRTLRYTPDGEDFVIINGDRKFNRALYGGHSGFRLETGDVPEFAFYLPRMGGNLSFAVWRESDSIPLNKMSHIESRYRAGSRIYTITDPSLGKGSIKITALALYDSDAAIWKIESSDIPFGTLLTWRFGGVADKRFTREGDLGVDPVDAFDFKPEYCVGNVYELKGNAFSVAFGEPVKPNEESPYGAFFDQPTNPDRKSLFGIFPENSSLWTDQYPALYGNVILGKEQYILIGSNPYSGSTDLKAVFDKTEASRAELAGRIRFNTPDPYMNTIGGALAVAADGVWDGQVWLHGAVGWRMPLSGWRAAYTGDALGWHDRARTHFNAYAASQVTEVPNTIPHPAQDPEMNLARSLKEWGTPQYSNGYICRNPYRNDQMHHYDMNLCYMDELLWHLNWTGDLEYARVMWPVITRHLAWEKLNYDPNNDGLYDAYACIWASDALYYNSGAVTHSTSYNYRGNKMAAMIAEKLGEDPTKYRKEAEKIHTALNATLWMPAKGYWAEYKDFMGKQRLHESAGVWTIYHAMDGEVADPFQAYQATRYVDTEIPHIPVKAAGLVDEGYETVATTNWLPYSWSINNVAFAEVMHTALAYFQAGRSEAGYKLLKSSVLDGMYLGSSPGNFGQVSFYDAARGECYRDFGDPVGIASRMFIQGLYGILPDAMNGRLLIKPGFPKSWPFAELQTSDISFVYKQDDVTDRYTISQHFEKPLTLELRVRARMDKINKITVNGNPATWKMVDDAVGYPLLSITGPATTDAHVEIEWGGEVLDTKTLVKNGVCKQGDLYKASFTQTVLDIFDPQQILAKGAVPGHRTYFAKLQQGDLSWWQPVHVEVTVDKKEIEPAFVNVVSKRCEPVTMDNLFNSSVTDIFRNEYLTPRSPYTTLQLPVQGIGEWCHPKMTADIDDSGMRSKIENNLLQTTVGVPFRTPSEGKNISFTSLWDNYPDQMEIPLSGKASRAYLLMAGSTNHMQCHIANGIIQIHYSDGTSETVELVNPENWCPIEQDFFVDGLSYKLEAPRPYRLHLKSGLVSNDLERDLNIKGVYGRPIDGGAGVLLDIKLNPKKKLKSLTLETLSNDVVIGIMGVTLQR